MAKATYLLVMSFIILVAIGLIDYTNMTGQTAGICPKFTYDCVNIGSDLSDEFGSELTRSDVCMFSGEINVAGDSANTKEILMLNYKGKSAGIATALTSSRKYNDLVLEIDGDAIGFFYIFDNSIDLTKATLDNPAETKFLGKSLKIARVSSDTSFNAFVGDSYQLSIGESVVINGKTIQLMKVGENGAIMISVEGTTELLSRGATKEINGLEITNREAFYDSSNILNNLADLIIGQESLMTIRDGDYYGNGTDWVWNVGDLMSDASTTTSTTSEFSGPFIGVINNLDYDDIDTAVTKGECISLPNNYLSICFNGTANEDYSRLEVDTDTIDLTELGGSSSQSAIRFKSGDNALHVGGTRVNEFWLANNLLYYDRGGMKEVTFDGTNVGEIEKLKITKAVDLYTIDSPVSGDDITFTFTTSGLGALYWNGEDITDDEGKLITKYGIIVKDVSSNLELSVPNNQVKAIISIISNAD